jgi:CheY-like chemotaxis protein
MRSILLIDDDADTRRSLREYLTGEGFLVHTARDGSTP